MEGHQGRGADAVSLKEEIGGNFSYNMDDNTEVMDEMEDQEESRVNIGESGKGKRKRSPIWKYFTEFSVVQSLEESLFVQPSVRFDLEKFRELLVLAIIRHNLPFTFVEYMGIRDLFAYVNSDIKLVNRNIAKADVVKIYHEQKSLLKNLLQHIPNRISLASDLWTSTAQDGYFCLTAHYIDSEWKLQHKILSFSVMPTPRNGVNLCEKLHNILTEWGIDKRLFSLTLDNASTNDVSVDLLKGQLNNRNALLCEGNFFHIRCCVHIINLIVQDGLKEMEMAICKVRGSVRYVRGSQAARQKFLDCVA